MNIPQTATARKRLPRVCFVLYALAAFSLILYFLFSVSTPFADWFNQHVSRVGRVILGFLTGWIPFSVAELLVILIPFFAVFLIVLAFRRFSDSWRSALVFMGGLLAVAATVLILFVWNFAAGYYASPVEDLLGLERKKDSAAELAATAAILSDEMNALEDEITFLPDGSSLMPYSYREMNAKLLDAYDQFCEKNGFLHTFPSRVKPIMLSEPMSYTHITGVYTFFTGEANVNVNFPDYTIPFTAAHELAHQRGIAREDEANFIAFLICLESDDPYIRYSGLMNVFDYVAPALSSADRETYRKVYADLDAPFHAERQAYSRFFDKYRENVAATVSSKTNDTYLKSQGQVAGEKSYDLVVDLTVAYFRPFFDNSDTTATGNGIN